VNLGYRPPAPETIVAMNHRPMMHYQSTWTSQIGLHTKQWAAQDRLKGDATSDPAGLRISIREPNVNGLFSACSTVFFNTPV
jgi:hypothetical protein